MTPTPVQTICLTLILLVGLLVSLPGCQRESPDGVPSGPPPASPAIEVAGDQAGGKLPEPSSADDHPAPALSDIEPAAVPPELVASPPSFSEPVTAALALSGADPSESNRIDAWIQVRIAGGHHVYAPGDEASALQSLAVELELPPGAEFDGDWIYPPAETDKGRGVYYESVLLRRRIRSTAAAGFTMGGRVRFQVCNEDVCFPPSTIEVTATLNPSP